MESKLAQLVYARVMGYDEQPCQDLPVENLFAEGAPCDRLYEQIYDAKLRICQRLGADEDNDIELILDSFDQITRLVAEKMFHYGTYFPKQR